MRKLHEFLKRYSVCAEEYAASQRKFGANLRGLWRAGRQEHQEKVHACFFSLRKDFSVHFPHNLFVDIKPQAVSLFIADIASSVKAVE